MKGRRSKRRSVRRRKSYRKKGRYTTVRRVTRYKRSNAYKLTTLMTPSLYPLPDRTIAKLRYIDYTMIDQFAATGYINALYRASNAYDPYLMTGGGSCTGYKQWSDNYDRATVLSSKIKVLVVDHGVDADYPYALTIRPQREPAATLTKAQLQNIREVRYAKQIYVEPTQSSPYCWRRLSMYMKTGTINGVSQKEVKDNPNEYGYPAGTATDPTLPWYWAIYFHYPWQVPASNLKVNLRVEIDYYIMFSDSKLIPID